jgi:phage terminase large subunit-like protein
MAWSLACPDWRTRLRAGLSPVPTLPLHQAEAARAISVFNKLRLPDVVGNPPMEEAAGDWFRDIVAALFGSLDPLTRQRHIRELFLLVPKKNSKTTNGALLMLTALLLNKRPRAKFILTAPTQDVAELAFAQAKGAVALDEVLSTLLHPRDHLKKIEHRRSGAELEIMTFDPSVLTGQKPAGVLIDELHVSAKMSKAASALRQLRGGMLAVPEAFLAFVTTQSEEPPVGIMRDELRKARRIRDGEITGAMLPVLYEFPEEMQRDPREWRNPKNWAMVTPNAGRSITIERLQEEFTTAEQTGEHELLAWASQHLNVEIGVALRSDAWAGAEYWEQQADETITLHELLRRSECVTLGIDGGGLDDLFGLAVLGRERGTGKWLAWMRAWAHPIVLKRREQEAARLRDFAAAGDLVIVERIGEDMAEIVSIAQELRASGLLPEKGGIGIDPGNSQAVVEALTAAGFDAESLAAVSQGWRLGGAIKLAERKLAEEVLFHADQPLMDWCVGNAKIEPKGNAMLITKQASGSAKIDPLMALFNAVELMARAPHPMRSIYDYDLPAEDESPASRVTAGFGGFDDD